MLPSTVARLGLLKSSELRLDVSPEDFLKSSLLRWDLNKSAGADALKSSNEPRTLLGASFLDCHKSSACLLDCLKSLELPFVLDEDLVDLFMLPSTVARLDFLKSSELCLDVSLEDFLKSSLLRLDLVKSADALKSFDESLALVWDRLISFATLTELARVFQLSFESDLASAFTSLVLSNFLISPA
jgi:hypothetical protein